MVGNQEKSSGMLQIISEDGEYDAALEPPFSDQLLLDIYSKMLTSRIVDAKGINLQRQGRLGNYTSCLGHEATQVGSTIALKEEDWIFPLYRDVAVVIARGVPILDLFDRFLGNSKDPMKGRDLPNLYTWRSFHIVSNAAPIASNLQLAVGLSMAAKIKKDPLVSITYFGDGATSSSEFHVSMNFAGVFKAPTIFLCENNQYAISLPVAKQTASATIAMKASAYGFEGIRVDGNDVLAVYKAVSEARTNAIKGEGPTLVECLTYRLSDHSTSDDSRRYRDKTELEIWRKKDPIQRFNRYLEKKGIWDASKDASLREDIESRVSAALLESEKNPLPEQDSMLDDVFAKRPDNLKFEE
jgi:pyruvate dehydrogenase E1 component alpha subunit